MQHCYIVRPHGRGFGFNAALAVFESVDQLVLRHRYVSLRNYFKDLDVMLTFPVGCQELLRRSSSESDKEMVLVKEGVYVNDPRGQRSGNASVYESIGTLKSIDESVTSTDKLDPVKENEYEDVVLGSRSEMSGVSGGDSKAGNSQSVGQVVKENKYETVQMPEETSDPGNPTVEHPETKQNKYEYIEFSEQAALLTKSTTQETAKGNEHEAVKENEYELVDLRGSTTKPAISADTHSPEKKKNSVVHDGQKTSSGERRRIKESCKENPYEPVVVVAQQQKKWTEV